MALCTLFYLAEYAAVPRMMMASASSEKVASPGDDACCDHCPQGAKKDHCPKPSKDCGRTADCCLNCPLCYVTVLPVAAEYTRPEKAAKEYALWASTYVYLYQASCWKPPNCISVSCLVA